MKYSSIIVNNYFRLYLNPLRTTTSFHFRRRLHLSPKFIPPLILASSSSRVSSSSSSSSSSKYLIKRTGNNDSYSLPYLYNQNLPYGRYAYDEYAASEEESDREQYQSSSNLVSIFIYTLIISFLKAIDKLLSLYVVSSMKNFHSLSSTSVPIRNIDKTCKYYSLQSHINCQSHII